MTLRSVPTFPSKETVKKPLETHSGCGLRQRRRSKRSKVPAVESINGLPMGQGHWIEHDGVSLRKPAGRLGVVSPCERSENKEEVWGRGVVDTGAFFGRNRRCLGWRF